VGEIGVVKKKISPEGKVFVHGELWFAKASAPLEEGSKVRVVKMEKLVLEVEPVEDAIHDADETP
jgi:membrane-bound serine protease (ClpP class)